MGSQDKKTIVLAYSCTKNYAYRLKRSLSLQPVTIENGERYNIVKVLLCDSIESFSEDEFAAYFDQIVEFKPFTYDLISRRRYFNLAKSRNTSLLTAKILEADFCFLCDSDTILVAIPDEIPEDAILLPKVYWQKLPNESLEESLEAVYSNDKNVFSDCNSWFIIPLKYYTKVRFCESIYGYGWEDVQFFNCLSIDNIPVKIIDVYIIHRYHKQEERSIDDYTWNRNKLIAEGTLLLKDLGFKYEDFSELDVVYGINPHWNSWLLLLPNIRYLIHMEHRTFANYDVEDDKFYVKWEKFGDEVYRFDGRRIVKIIGQQSETQIYDNTFYDSITTISVQSASRCVPLVYELFKPESVIDVGCGRGAFLAEFVKCGIKDYLGLDGDYIDKNSLLISPDKFKGINLTNHFTVDSKYDLAVCLEVAEHIPQSRIDNFIDLLCNVSPVVWFSAAIPFQGGTGHVNEQWPSYWIEKFAQRNFSCFDILRPTWIKDPEVAWWYAQNSLLFWNEAKVPVSSFSKFRELLGRNLDGAHIVHSQLYYVRIQELQNLTS